MLEEAEKALGFKINLETIGLNDLQARVDPLPRVALGILLPQSICLLRGQYPKPLSRETIRREILSQRIDADQAQAIIDALVEAGWLREVTMKGHQHRPARRWQVNPLLGAGRSGRLRRVMAGTARTYRD